MIFRRKIVEQPSTLSAGWHPAYLISIKEEQKPESFTLMKEETLLRWYVRVWAQPRDVASGEPEYHTAFSSLAFSENSKAFKWVSSLTESYPDVGEEIELGLPLACRVKIERRPGTEREFVRIVDFEPWPEAPAEPPASITGAQTAFSPPQAASVPHRDEDDIPF